MKRKSFYTIIAALIAFSSNAWADTDKLPAADGWTKITTVPTSAEIGSNYYVFVDATRDLMLGIGKGVQNTKAWYSLALYYRTSVEPTSKDINPMVWTLESNDGGFSMRNLDQPVHLFQTENNAAWYFDTNDVTSSNSWSKINLAYSDGKWTIENSKFTGNYIGPWNDNNFTNGAECAGNKTTALRGYFQIYAISRAKFKQNLLDNASSSNPVDLTPWYVSNPTFDGGTDEGKRTGWTEEGSGGNNNTHERGGGCEIWHRSGFNIHQDLTIPNGKYKVSLQMAGTSGAGKVYGTSNGTTKEAASSAAAGANFQSTILSMIQDRTFGQTITDEITVSNGSLTIGMKCETTDQWINFDNFKLYCTGLDLSAYVSQLSDLVDDCNDFIASDVVPTACENAISSAITTYNQSYATAKEYSTAIVALTAVLDTYSNDTELQTAYSDYKTMRTNVQGLENTSTYKYTDPGSAKSTLDTAISSANTAVEAATTASAINTQTANIRAAAMTFISSVTAEEGNPFNLMFLASQVYSDWKKKDGSAAGIVGDAFLANRPEDIPPFAENFEWTAATTGNVLYQTVSGLPIGYYQVGMYAMALSTSNRDGMATEATEGDADRSFAFAGDLTDATSIQRTGLPIKFATSIDFTDLTTLDVNVHLTSAGDLTFGVQKDKNGSNWHFAQIMTIAYSKDPDLTGLKETRDALVSEAQGLLASDDANLLTTEQQNALNTAISTAEAANTFEDLNEVTLTTLPNAINTARSQIQTVKDNRVLMLAALERFETDYNLADGTDYQRSTMSATAWTDLLAKVNAVSEALDDISLSSEYATRKNALVAQMGATDTSLRLFKSYKAMVEGCTALSIAGSYGADSNMDTDDTQQTAITALNTAFVTYNYGQTADFDVSAFLGSNLNFSAAEGAALNTENSNNIHEVTGWEVSYADADQWAVVQTHQSENDGKLYMRKNWGSAATTLSVSKLKMLPAGKYRLSFSWNSNMANMTNLSQFKVGEATTAIGESGDKTLTYEFTVTEAAKPFDLTFGFQKQYTGNSPAQIIVDDVTLTALGVNSILLADYDDEAAEFDATGYTAASGATLEPTNANQIIYANAGQLTNTNNVVISGTCANFVITDKVNISTTHSFSATAATYSREMAEATQYGTLLLPFPIDVENSDVDFFTLKEVTIGDGKMTFTPVTTATIDAGTPLLFKKQNSEATSINVVGSGAVSEIGESASVTQGGWTATGYYQGNDELSGVNTYYIAGDHFWNADGNNLIMSPFRVVYISPTPSSAKALIIRTDSTPTEIVDIQSGTQLQGDVYSISGQLLRRNLKSLSELPRGTYIIGGKKVAIP